jgi:hypothetical protein
MADFRQTPEESEVFLDHVAHWVPDMDAAAAEFERLGFLLTPYTEHANSTAPGEPVLPAGSANRCIMLREGYLEILTPTADTAIGQELRAGIERYVGVHLAAFSCTDAEAQRERLVAAGFDQRPVVDLRRETETADGAQGTLRFTVIRPVPGVMAEGRIQFLSHHTPDLLWEARWLAHPNTVERLSDLVICVANPDEAAARFERYMGRPARRISGGWLITFERGQLALLGQDAAESALGGVSIPVLPYIAGYVLRCGSLDACKSHFERKGVVYRELTENMLAVPQPAFVGGILLFAAAGSGTPWAN